VRRALRSIRIGIEGTIVFVVLVVLVFVLVVLQARVAALKQQGTSSEDAAKLLVDEFKK
jgi:hypothetical protein